MMQNLIMLQVFKSVKWIQYNIMWIGSRGVYPLFFITTIHYNPKSDVVLDCFLSCCKLYFTAFGS